MAGVSHATLRGSSHERRPHMGGFKPEETADPMGDTRIAILTQHAPPEQAGGVEVFNESLRRSFGHVEIFSDEHREAGDGGLRRVLGLEGPAEAVRAARALLRRHEEDPFDVILSNGLYGWPLTLARPGVPLATR